jgi:NADH-quinone oxidoreductase subunit D
VSDTSIRGAPPEGPAPVSADDEPEAAERGWLDDTPDEEQRRFEDDAEVEAGDDLAATRSTAPAGATPARSSARTGALREETMIINMGPQHPSTHGVLRLVLELDGEYVVSARPVIGYLHTGIEKNCEYRTWQQGVTFVTRADYLSPTHNELAYCLAAERLVGIEAPPRAQVIRVMMNELTRIQSHLVWLATSGLELGAVSMMLYGFREREQILDIFEMVTGLRMNYAFIRIGGTVMDLPDGADRRIRRFLDMMPGRIDEYEGLLSDNPIWLERNRGIGVLSARDALELGVSGPVLRASGVAMDVRKDFPYSGYETYDFDVVTAAEGDCYARYEVRLREMRQSLRIVEQCLERLRDTPGPVMVQDTRVAWPAALEVGPDGIGNSPAYVTHIMEESMEALINHFKMVTHGIDVPPGEVYQPVESARGELGYYVVSSGDHRPYRVKIRDPSFSNLQAAPILLEDGLIADAIACIASLDPVMGGVDR